MYINNYFNSSIFCIIITTFNFQNFFFLTLLEYFQFLINLKHKIKFIKKFFLLTELIFFLLVACFWAHSPNLCCSKAPLKKMANSMLLFWTVWIKTAKNWTMRFHWPPHTQSLKKKKSFIHWVLMKSKIFLIGIKWKISEKLVAYLF